MMSDLWYYAEGGATKGPLSLEELINCLKRTLSADDVLVWQQGFSDWVRAASVPELARQLVIPPPLAKKGSSGWRRIGVVVSVVWIFIGGSWGNSLGIHAGDWAVNLLSTCYEVHPDDWSGCSATFEKQFTEATKYHWYMAAFFAFVPIPITWLLAIGLVRLFRWIRAGFRPST